MPRLPEDRQSPLSVALELDSHGWNVFPAKVGGNHPQVEWKEYQGKRTAGKLNSWFAGTHPRDYWVGTGVISRLVVLDCDNDEADRYWRDKLGDELLDSTVAVKTKRGHHYYFRLDEPMASWSVHPGEGQSGPSFDVRADRAGVTVPPSKNKTWLRPPTEWSLEPVPDLLKKPSSDMKDRASGGGGTRSKLSELLENPPQGEGAGRNQWMSQVAGHYAKTFRFQDVYEAHCRIANGMINPSLDEAEYAKTIESIWQSEAAKDGADRHRASPTSQASLSDSQLTKLVQQGVLEGRFCWTAGLGWLAWDGKRWDPSSDVRVVEALRLFFLEMFKARADAGASPEEIRMMATLLSAAKIKNALFLARGVAEVRESAFDAHPDLLNVGNGVVDLRTGELQPHSPGLWMTRITDVNYEPGAAHPYWAAALEALPEDVRDWWQLRVGQSATGHMSPDDVLLVCQGGGENGKTTLLGAIQRALGEYAVLVSDRVLLADPGQHPTELMDLRGARFALIEETPEARRLSVSRLKKTVGTPEISARRVYANPVTFRATHTLFLTSNYRPQIEEVDHGTWRRLALVRFPFTFRREGKGAAGPDDRPSDPNLRRRLVERPDAQRAVLRWIVDGSRRWYESGEVMSATPGRVEADTEDWRMQADHILAYVREGLTFDPDSHVTSADMLFDFNSWLRARGHREWGDQTFAERFGGHAEVVGHGVKKAKLLSKKASRPLTRGFDRPLPELKLRQWSWTGVRFRTSKDDAESAAENAWNGLKPGASGVPETFPETPRVEEVLETPDAPGFTAEGGSR